MLTEKWLPLDYQGRAITDPHRRAVTDNYKRTKKPSERKQAFQDGGSMLSEAPTNATGASVDNFDHLDLLDQTLHA